MPKPEKKNISYKIRSSDGDIYDEGYNAACDDWEKWLPSEEEILDIICKTLYPDYSLEESIRKQFIPLAKAISQRIRGE